MLYKTVYFHLLKCEPICFLGPEAMHLIGFPFTSGGLCVMFLSGMVSGIFISFFAVFLYIKWKKSQPTKQVYCDQNSLHRRQISLYYHLSITSLSISFLLIINPNGKIFYSLVSDFKKISLTCKSEILRLSKKLHLLRYPQNMV